MTFMSRMAKNLGFTLLSPSNNSKMYKNNISIHARTISSKIYFSIHLTIIYRDHQNETSLFSNFQHARQIIVDLKILKFHVKIAHFYRSTPLEIDKF